MSKKPNKETSYEEQVAANTKPPKEKMFRADDPYVLFGAWMEEAKAGEPNDPNAMSIATVDENGLPDVRMVLLKGVDERGFVFYSHAGSAKGKQLAHNPKAALNFHWKSLRRQIRVRGTVEPLSKLEVGEYFASRPRESQLGAWASQQSKTMETRGIFEKAIEAAKDKFSGMSVPLPPGWRGWRVRPEQIEFWRDRPFRLHDRLLFEWDAKSKTWTKRRLYP